MFDISYAKMSHHVKLTRDTHARFECQNLRMSEGGEGARPRVKLGWVGVK